MCEECCNGIDVQRRPCERCAEMLDCTHIDLHSRRIWLCEVCMRNIENLVIGTVDTYNPDASTVYVQLSRDEIRRLRDETSYGMIPAEVQLDMAQRTYIYDLLFNQNSTDWDLGLVDEPPN